MKYLLLALVCLITGFAKAKPKDIKTALIEISSQKSSKLNPPKEMVKLGTLALKVAAPVAVDPMIVKVIGLSAVTNDQYLGWIKASVGFKPGEITQQALQGLGPDNGMWYVWRVLKKWPDGSVRIGQIKTVGYFIGQGIVAMTLVSGKTPKAGFAWHPAVLDAVLTNRFQDQLKIHLTVAGEPLECRPALGQYKFLHVDAAEIIVRFRSHCFNRTSFALRPLSMTSWVTLMSDDPLVRMSLALGNDTREEAVTGGIQLSGVTIVPGNLPTIRWVNEPSYGNKSPLLADGQTMAWKTVVSLDPGFDSSARHVATGEPMGFQYYVDAVASGAFGVAPLPPSRIPPHEVVPQHALINSQAPFPVTSSANSYLGMINQSPPNTGAQPDFASTAPIAVQKAQQTYSSRQMAAVLLATYRESYRPSFYWETRDGVEDWVKNTSYPDLFFWSGKPHFDFSWNNQYPQWRSRTSNPAGFQGGSAGGWQGQDNQHFSISHLRHGFELTGDVLLEEWLKYNTSLLYFNFFTDWINHPEAERAGRSMKEAVALTELFPDLPESQLFKPKIVQKFQVYYDGVSQHIARFGHVGNNLMDACDPRVNQNGAWPVCPIQQAAGQGALVVGNWQVGFLVEALMIAPKPDMRYLAASTEYFAKDGFPKTYHLITDPSNYITGGIGIQWWAPWVTHAMKVPDAEGAKFVLTVVKPVLEARFQNGCGFPSPYFCLNDDFRTW